MVSNITWKVGQGEDTDDDTAIKTEDYNISNTERGVLNKAQWLQRYGWEILPHPAHSPDLAPSDFHLFGPLKRHLGGMAFETEDDLISELRNWFDNLDVDFFRVGINLLLSLW
ncbi:histone-lysine N-methyltransferase SETMAR [Plakobranchus ocellatus]|uniref:Histone-lysine N-methyltransferase SETMAR n=1 Tax=Plakobranchus ocellatus TaxID=259542 RepID=A0AAV4C8A8_9GAST|nr:histone-lysine N-methyltransferase SETMAR [Plakobranchus ocellatus]